jgi:predicted ATP-grasp superfamily ATP-dependent carboligase
MPDKMREQVVIAGISTRALAASAARAGYRVTAVDAFGDMDLRRTADVIAGRSGSGDGFEPLSAACAADAIRGGLACYTSSFENYPAAVERLALNRTLLGNQPSVLKRVRDPLLLMNTLRQLGFSVPKTRLSAPTGRSAPETWLLKPRRSGGGHGTGVWRRRQPVARTHYLQQRLAGWPGSILFAADGHRAVVLGISRQIVGDSRLGVRGFRYCGSLLGPLGALFPDQPQLTEIARRLASAVAREFGVRGLNGIDFIASGGVPIPIEVNPRYSASMELLERTGSRSIFPVHEQACRGALPSAGIDPERVLGKAVVFARKNVVMRDTREWLEDAALADIPHPGEKILRGRPICTVFGSGDDADSCYERLVRRAAAVHREAESGKRSAA